jgi:hypothetical protein
MLASELLGKLEELVVEHGDFEIYIEDIGEPTRNRPATKVEYRQYGYGKGSEIFHIEGVKGE